MSCWDDVIDGANAATRAAGRWREIRTLDGGAPRTRTADGRPVVSFASNDYLGLSQHPAVVAAAHLALDRDGAGAGAARLIVGGRTVHDELEAAIARWKGTEAALLFPTGFAANLGVLGALARAAGRDRTVVFSDELNHASIIDGARMSGAEVVVVPHRDVGALRRLLEGRDRPHAVVVSDTVFSMDGDVAPVDDLAAACADHGALLVLDEAHAVLGPPTPRPDGATVVSVGTQSKTLGALGGHVAGPRPLIDLLVNTARSFIFTTAPTPADTAAALAALAVVTSAEGDRLRERLRANIDLIAPGHPSPIVPVVLGDEDRAMKIAAALLERGLLVPAIRPPTVPAGTCRLRIALSAVHDPADLGRLAEALEQLGVGTGAAGAPTDQPDEPQGDRP